MTNTPKPEDDINEPKRSSEPAVKKTSKETIELKARKVLSGEYGTGGKRKQALAGDYDAVMNRVKDILNKKGTER